MENVEHVREIKFMMKITRNVKQYAEKTKFIKEKSVSVEITIIQ